MSWFSFARVLFFPSGVEGRARHWEEVLTGWFTGQLPAVTPWSRVGVPLVGPRARSCDALSDRERGERERLGGEDWALEKKKDSLSLSLLCFTYISSPADQENNVSTRDSLIVSDQRVARPSFPCP